MKRKNKYGRPHVYLVAIVVILIVLSIGLSFLVLNYDSSSRDSTFVLQGKITEKDTSCGKETLQSDGTVKRGIGICDGGNSIVVNSLRISTGGGGLTAKPPKYITAITSVHAGDIVEVRYVKDSSGLPSTDCRSCYVKKVN